MQMPTEPETWESGERYCKMIDSDFVREIGSLHRMIEGSLVSCSTASFAVFSRE